jgi:hypothetical protein
MMIKTETAIWKTIEDFPRYEINELGDIREKLSGNLLPKAKFNYVDYVELMRDGKPYLQHVNRLRWKSFNLANIPSYRTDIQRHGIWLKDQLRYEDGEKSHLCGVICSVGEV